MATYTSNVNRLTGLNSGIDTEAMVDQIMQAESAKYESLQKKQTWTSWKQEAYREVISELDAFQSKWLSSTSSSSLRYSSTFNSYSSTILDKNTGEPSNAIKVNSINTTAECNIKVEQLAAKNSFSSVSQLKKGINSTKTASEMAKAVQDAGEKGISLKFTLDGLTKEITITKADLENYKVPLEEASSQDDAVDETQNEQALEAAGEVLLNVLGEKLQDAFGVDDGKAKVFITKNDEGKLSFKTTDGHTLTISDVKSGSCSKLGLTSGDSSTATEKTKLGDILGSELDELIKDDSNPKKDDNALTLNFGGKDVTITSDDTIETMINKINSSGVNFNLSYNKLSETFKIETKEAGESNRIEVSNPLTKKFLKDCLKIDLDNKEGENYVEGKDAIIVINGVKTSRTSNDIEFNGLNFTITELSVGQEFTVKSEQDVDAVYNKLSEFVNEYNKLVESLNSKILETRAKSDSYGYYEPLTEAQKEAMSSEEIEKWEKQAKTGLLYNDSSISSILTNLRSCLYETVKTSGGSISLYEIGITTSSNWQDNGKLVIDEKKLKEAIRTRETEIQTLFTQMDTGLGDKFNNVFEGAIGRKDGVLRNKAGIKNTSSQDENILSKELKALAKRISEEKQRLYNKELRYFEMFSKMENSIAQQNSQLESLYQLLGS